MAEELTNLFGTEEETITEELTECAEVETDEQTTNEVEEQTATDESAPTADEQQGADETPEENEEVEDTKLTPQEEFFVEKLNEYAKEDEYLATALKRADKSIRKCFDYMREKARKMLQKGGNCVAVEGTEMLGWAKHYYIESNETIESEMPKKPTYDPKKAEEDRKKREELQKKAEETKKKVYENPLLASLMKKGGKVENAENGEVAVTKTTTKKDENGNVVSSKSVKTDESGTRTTTITKDGVTHTMTEFALF